MNNLKNITFFIMNFMCNYFLRNVYYFSISISISIMYYYCNARRQNEAVMMSIILLLLVFSLRCALLSCLLFDVVLVSSYMSLVLLCPASSW
jgi:hypothetical protein